MWSQRSVVDYALARRATLAGLLTGRTSTYDVCDAHPYLLRAAKFHGEQTEDSCPVCRKERLTHVSYTYGDCFPQEVQGRVRRKAELDALARELPEFTVYVVEVCRGCHWNHLTSSFVLGTGDRSAAGKAERPRQRRARSGAAES